MNNYMLIHGSFGSPFVNWFPYLRNEIEKRELVVYTPDFPTGVGYQNYEIRISMKKEKLGRRIFFMSLGKLGIGYFFYNVIFCRIMRWIFLDISIL